MRLPTWCQLAVLGILSAGCDNNDSSTCETRVTKRLEVEPSDPPLKVHLDRCRLDVDACPELCQVALSRINLTHPVVSCKVGFVGQLALLDVEYRVLDTDSGCFFDEPHPIDGVGGGF